MTSPEVFACAWQAQLMEWRRILDLHDPPLTWLQDLRLRLRSGEFLYLGAGGVVIADPFFHERVEMLDRVTHLVHVKAGTELFPLDLLPAAPDDLSSLDSS